MVRDDEGLEPVLLATFEVRAAAESCADALRRRGEGSAYRVALLRDELRERVPA